MALDEGGRLGGRMNALRKESLESSLTPSAIEDTAKDNCLWTRK